MFATIPHAGFHIDKSKAEEETNLDSGTRCVAALGASSSLASKSKSGAHIGA